MEININNEAHAYVQIRMYALVQICYVVVSPNFKSGNIPITLDVVVSPKILGLI